ncbi:MAG: hypothetical protein K6A90_15950 [Lachnospiraceae bacterium]|nr:hypothetical protein [Lachnospiraceae bacterium]
MENNIQEKYKIEDDVLENVNGGASKKRDIYYCGKKHTLFRLYPWRIRPAGSKKWYNNGCRYDCEVNGPFFTLQLVSGRTAYFDAHCQQLP